MKRMIRSLRSSLGAVVILCASAGALLGDTSAAPNSQDSSGTEQQLRHQNELTFTQIDVPGAAVTLAVEINKRGQMVGAFIDAAGEVHGFLAECDAKKSPRRGVGSSSSAGRTCGDE